MSVNRVSQPTAAAKPTDLQYLPRGAAKIAAGLIAVLAALALMATPALAAGPPVLETETASAITSSTVTLAGTLNPAGSAIEVCEFEYASEAAYQQALTASAPDPYETGAKAACVAPLPGAVEVSEAVTTKPVAGLEPNTTYHYRLVATNSAGTENGPDQTFTTSPVAPAVNDRAPFASNITQFSATLNATIDPGNAVVNYHFEYGTSTAYGTIAPLPDLYTPVNNTDDAITQAVSGLQAGTTYHYRIVASSPGATNVTGPDETFTTLPIPAPAVSTAAASGVGVGSVTFSGAIDPQGWDTEYLFQYGTSSAYGQSWPTVPVALGALQGPQPVQVYVERLQPGTTYHYRLLATNGGGTSYGPDITFTTTQYPVSAIQETPLLAGPVATTKTKAKTTKALKCKRGFVKKKHNKCVRKPRSKKKNGKKKK